jgi:SAM-dependent methyltransferase
MTGTGAATQEEYRRLFARRRPGWVDSQTLYRDLVDAEVDPSTRVLDVGCGHADLLAPILARAASVVGVDPDPRALEANSVIGEKVVGRAEQLPFADGSFDLVLMAWVVEHLDEPYRAVRELRRVLRPGGRVILLTPNAWNYTTWLIRAIPHRFHDRLNRRLYHRQPHDTYPVRYRMNTTRRLDRGFAAAGFRGIRMLLNGDPTYVGVNRPLFEAACAVENLLDLPVLRRARVHLLAVYERL